MLRKLCEQTSFSFKTRFQLRFMMSPFPPLVVVLGHVSSVQSFLRLLALVPHSIRQDRLSGLFLLAV